MIAAIVGLVTFAIHAAAWLIGVMLVLAAIYGVCMLIGAWFNDSVSS